MHNKKYGTTGSEKYGKPDTCMMGNRNLNLLLTLYVLIFPEET